MVDESKMSVVRSAETDKLYVGLILSGQDEMSDLEEQKHTLGELTEKATNVKTMYEKTFGTHLPSERIQLINLVELY